MAYKQFGIVVVILIGGVFVYLFIADPSPETAVMPSSNAESSINSQQLEQPDSERGVDPRKTESDTRTQLPDSAGEKDSDSYHPIEDELVIDTNNTLHEYINDENGLPVKVIDDDASSFSYRKPLKLIQYADGKVTSLTSYQYFESETVVTTLTVAYRPDGSVEDYRESVESHVVQN